MLGPVAAMGDSLLRGKGRYAHCPTLCSCHPCGVGGNFASDISRNLDASWGSEFFVVCFEACWGRTGCPAVFVNMSDITTEDIFSLSASVVLAGGVMSTRDGRGHLLCRTDDYVLSTPPLRRSVKSQHV